MAIQHSTYAPSERNPYVTRFSDYYWINADGYMVQSHKPRDTKHPIIRFLEKMVVSESLFFEGSPCWEWQGCRQPNGYGQFKIDGRRGAKKSSPHIFSHLYFIGEVPEGYEVDHRCKVRWCCSPFHLEAVTVPENRRRRSEHLTHCKHGHAFTEDNTRLVGNSRKCKTCESIRVLIYYAHSDSPNAPASERASAQRRLERAIAQGDIPISRLGRHAKHYAHLLDTSSVDATEYTLCDSNGLVATS